MGKENTCSTSREHEEKHEIQDHEIRKTLSQIRHKILVMSGKGGVGKSSVAAYLAHSLAKRGYAVGLMDVDLHGPSIPRLLGLREGLKPSFLPNKAMPVDYLDNLKVISIESLLGENKDVATIWRGPIKIGVIRQFISDIQWPELDYLIIDSPPGTGDEPLTIAQTIPDAKALIVTTPQEISLADVRKSINFCRQVQMEILGLVENMSGFQCPHCGKRVDLFGSGGGEITARKEHLTLLASLPLEPRVVQEGDQGRLGNFYGETNGFAKAFGEMVDRIIEISKKEEVSMETTQTTDVKTTASDGGCLIAVPVSNGILCAHFGHCDQFALIQTENGKIKGKTLSTPPPHEPGVIPRWLSEKGAQVIIAGGMGSRAQQLFGENGIKVVTGAPSDTPEALVDQYLKNTLVSGPNTCDH